MPDRHPDGVPSPLAHFARRCESRPDFLAHPLALYRDSRGWTDDDLAAWLGCPAASLVGLMLCGLPRHVDDVRAISGQHGCDAGRLGVCCGIPAN